MSPSKAGFKLLKKIYLRIHWCCVLQVLEDNKMKRNSNLLSNQTSLNKGYVLNDIRYRKISHPCIKMRNAILKSHPELVDSLSTAVLTSRNI